MRYDNRNCLLTLPLMHCITQKLFKKKPIDDYHLIDDRIDIWQIALDSMPDWAFPLLNEEEKARAQRFHFERHQRRFTVARAWLRVILSRYAGQAPETLNFGYNKQGKPHLPNNHQLTFNLSHSHELALLAIGCHQPLGIDVEYFSKRPFMGIAEQLFSPKEIEDLTQTNPPLMPLAFFNIWSQKEALIKACGLGLAYPTKEFNVPLLASQSSLITDKLHDITWQMLSFMPQAACSAALCCHPSIKQFFWSSISELRYS